MEEKKTWPNWRRTDVGLVWCDELDLSEKARLFGFGVVENG